MQELGHTHPGLALRIYAHAMRRDEDENDRLHALVEGSNIEGLGTGPHSEGEGSTSVERSRQSEYRS
jgi:hypothetical protein